MKYVASFQPGFNPEKNKGDIVVYFSDKTHKVFDNLSPDTFNALLNTLEQKNITFHHGWLYCGYPHNAVEILKKANCVLNWE